MYFAYFNSFSPPKTSKMDNYCMVKAFFGNYISKCNIRPIQDIEVLYRLRNNQKHYLISPETPCSSNARIKASLLYLQEWLLRSHEYSHTNLLHKQVKLPKMKC